jgi:chromosome segregation ATPase
MKLSNQEIHNSTKPGNRKPAELADLKNKVFLLESELDKKSLALSQIESLLSEKKEAMNGLHTELRHKEELIQSFSSKLEFLNSEIPRLLDQFIELHENSIKYNDSAQLLPSSFEEEKVVSLMDLSISLYEQRKNGTRF